MYINKYVYISASRLANQMRIEGIIDSSHSYIKYCIHNDLLRNLDSLFTSLSLIYPVLD